MSEILTIQDYCLAGIFPIDQNIWLFPSHAKRTFIRADEFLSFLTTTESDQPINAWIKKKSHGTGQTVSNAIQSPF